MVLHSAHRGPTRSWICCARCPVRLIPVKGMDSAADLRRVSCCTSRPTCLRTRHRLCRVSHGKRPLTLCETRPARGVVSTSFGTTNFDGSMFWWSVKMRLFLLHFLVSDSVCPPYPPPPAPPPPPPLYKLRPSWTSVTRLRRTILDEGIRLSVGTYCWTFHRSADKLRPCPSYSGRRDRINLVPNLIRYKCSAAT